MKKKLSFIILALAIISIITFWQYSVWQAKNIEINTPEQLVSDNIPESATPAIEPIPSSIQVTFIFSASESKTIDYQLTENNTENLLAITKKISLQENWSLGVQDYGELGTLVTKINDTENGQDKKYWQYFVDGKQPQISASQYIPQANEKIEWRFAESKF